MHIIEVTVQVSLKQAAKAGWSDDAREPQATMPKGVLS